MKTVNWLQYFRLKFSTRSYQQITVHIHRSKYKILDSAADGDEMRMWDNEACELSLVTVDNRYWTDRTYLSSALSSRARRINDALVIDDITQLTDRCPLSITCSGHCAELQIDHPRCS